MIEWFNSNPLHANPCEFQNIKFKSAKKVNAWVLSLYWGTGIEFQPEINIPGVCIDEDMNFNNSHVNDVYQKAGKQAYALQRLTGVPAQKSIMAIYQSFVMANFDFCRLVWLVTSRNSICKLKKSRKGLYDFYWKILCHAMTNSYLKQRWMLSGSAQWTKWPLKHSIYCHQPWLFWKSFPESQKSVQCTMRHWTR